MAQIEARAPAMRTRWVAFALAATAVTTAVAQTGAWQELWSPFASPSGPQARQSQSLLACNSTLILFGGYGSVGFLGDLWTVRDRGSAR